MFGVALRLAPAVLESVLVVTAKVQELSPDQDSLRRTDPDGRMA